MVESHKILDKIKHYLVQPLCEIGCGDATIIEDCFGIDGRDFPCVDFVTDGLYGLKEKLEQASKPNKFKCLISSHTGEHLPDMFRTVNEWSDLVVSGGYFILYLPQSGAYNNYENPEHFYDTEYKSFLFWITQTFCGGARNYKGEQYAPAKLEVIESGLDIEEEEHYSFYIVLKKL
jgi:hypothetical protein